MGTGTTTGQQLNFEEVATWHDRHRLNIRNVVNTNITIEEGWRRKGWSGGRMEKERLE